MSEETKYTKSDLEDMSRVLLRQTAVKVLQLANKDAASLRSDDIIQKILEAQKGGGKKGKAATKERPAPKSKEPDPPEDQDEKEAEDEEPEVRAKGSNGASDSVLKAIHAVCVRWSKTP